MRVIGDGNYLFTSVAANVILQINSGNVFIEQVLIDLGIARDNFDNITNLQHSLRQLTVREWMGNLEFYQSFVTVDLSSICEQYFESGQFGGELGDLIVVTLANVLQHPIIVFTSVSNMPVLCFTPMRCNNSNPLFLTFIQSGPGHVEERGTSKVKHAPYSDVCVCDPVKHVVMPVHANCVQTHMAYVLLHQVQGRGCHAAQQQPLAGCSSKFIAKIDEDLKLGCLTTFEEIILKKLSLLSNY